jgi:hypothetical protein
MNDEQRRAKAELRSKQYWEDMATYNRERKEFIVQTGNLSFRIIEHTFRGRKSYGAEITSNGVTTITWKSPATPDSAMRVVRRKIKQMTTVE